MGASLGDRIRFSFVTHEDWRYTYFLEYNAEVAQRSEMNKAWRQLSAVFFIMQVYRFTWQFICPNWVTGGVWVAKTSPACNKNIVDPTIYFYCNREWASINSTSCRKYLTIDLA